MKSVRISITGIAIAAAVLLIGSAVGITGNTVMNAEHTLAPDMELPVQAQPVPLQLEAENKTALTPKRPRLLNRADAGSERSVSAGPQPQSGNVYTWRDGDQTKRVVLQVDLVVESTKTMDPGDVGAVARTVQGAIRSKTGREGGAQPVFRSESGGGLMTLPGGVLLLLDPAWRHSRIDRFFTENGISEGLVTELEFLDNAFLVKTEPGFPSLDLANALSLQEGVVTSSPNWWQEMSKR